MVTAQGAENTSEEVPDQGQLEVIPRSVQYERITKKATVLQVLTPNEG